MSRSRSRLLCIVVGAAVSTSLGCWEQVSYDWFPQMKKQIVIQAFEDTEVPGHPQGFTPPEGAVSVSEAPLPDPASMGFAEQDAIPNPVPVSLASLKNGEKLFNRYCSACHGRGGAGDGPVAGAPFGTGPFGLVLPVGGPNSVARAFTDGHIYSTITLGRNRMPSYRRIAARDRWDIVNYVRELNGQNAAVAQGGGQ